MSLKSFAEELGWYSPDLIFNPPGSGAKIYANLVKEKIERALRFYDKTVKVGILVNDPTAQETQHPIAIICEFNKQISSQTLNIAHKLAWNFGRSLLLIIIDSSQVQVLSCYKKPIEFDEYPKSFQKKKKSKSSLFEEPHDAQIFQFPLNKSHLPHQAAEHLRWIELVSGEFLREHEKQFPIKERVDQLLLENLKYIRSELHKMGLSYRVIHDLLARLIFIQFLFQRKDSNGQPAIDDDFLNELFTTLKWSKPHRYLPDILNNYEDAYSFFRWLNDKFNGDLFPGQGATATERETEWELERTQVKAKHLKKLADFISGDIQLKKGQRLIWKRYAFDVIPLEFISSIYEVFVQKSDEELENQDELKGVHYTPNHLVDFILDNPQILPWDGEQWDLKILDPACGSGIFLVKAFQRLVQRWKNSQEKLELSKIPEPKFLVSLLAENIYGVDINEDAVRVASFSLYLAVCDELDPRKYWLDWEFPRMRDAQIKPRDFFDERPLFQVNIEYDLILGNAPWGKNTLTNYAKKWAKDNKWELSYKDIGPLFLPKAASFLKKDTGIISMMQPIINLLFNANGLEFRQRLFSEYKVLEILNLSALRFSLFGSAISPSCVLTMLASHPDDEPMEYICPKKTQTVEDDERILIEPQDIKEIFPDEALNLPYIWTALMWGNRRDLKLIGKLKECNSLGKMLEADNPKVVKRQGIIRGKSKRKEQKEIKNRRILEEDDFPNESFLTLRAESLPRNNDSLIYWKDSTDLSAFKLPQLLLKKSWKVKNKRFRAVIVESKKNEGVLTNSGYVSVHTPNERDKAYLESACLSFNSKLATYFLLLTSGRFATYRPEVEPALALSVPIPEPRPGLLKGLEDFSTIDERIYKMFDFEESEQVLIEELFNFTLADFKGDANSPGRLPTERIDEPELSDYCEYFKRVIKSGFGNKTKFSATIFQEKDSLKTLSVRMIRIALDSSEDESIKIDTTDYQSLWSRLKSLNEKVMKPTAYHQKVYKGYEIAENEQGLIIYLVKPDQKHYWLRSQALYDADKTYAEIIQSVYQNCLSISSDSKMEDRKIA